MSSEAGPKILVVANPDAQAELCEALAGAGFTDVDVGDGGDDTFVHFETTRPDVAVVCADLDRGDARALASAIRSTEHGDIVQLVLVGDADGPVRNALDAADYDVDRFVGRPLSPKALAFAARTCARVAAEARARADEAIEAEPEPEAVEPEPGAVEPPPAVEDQGVAPGAIERAVDDAIDDFLQDAIGALSDTVAVDVDDRGHPKAPAPGPDPVDDGWDVPAPPPPREPTMILSGGGQAPAPRPVAHDETERESGIASTDSADETAKMGEGAAPADEDAPPAGGRGFGRQLRRKMSMMAERLFSAQGVEPRVASFDAGLAHDHHTEIDLTSLGVDTEPGIDQEVGPYEDMRAAQTYADPGSSPGDDASGSSPTAPPTDEARTTTRRPEAELPARGSIVPGETDAAVLMARAFAAELTGRVVLRRAPAEKVLCFEQGRPVFATSNLPHDRMGDLLYREGKITREQHARSRELVMESGRRMGEILVERGFLKRRELLPAVRRHIEDIIYSLFGWRSGEFEVVTGSAAEGEHIRLSRHPAALILEGVRRKYDLDLLASLVGTAESVLTVRDPDLVKAVVGVADLSQAERSAIDAFDGVRTMQDVADEVDLDVLGVCQLAYGLLAMGAAERADEHIETFAEDRAPSLVGETDLAIDRQRVMAKHAMVGEADYFTLLGVRRDASGFEIKRAYQAARRDYATDSFPVEVRRELSEEIDEINELLDEAYSVLRNDRLRASYRSHLRD